MVQVGDARCDSRGFQGVLGVMRSSCGRHEFSRERVDEVSEAVEKKMQCLRLVIARGCVTVAGRSEEAPVLGPRVVMVIGQSKGFTCVTGRMRSFAVLQRVASVA